MEDVLKKLRGGDRRSIGRVAEVVEEVLRRPRLFPALLNGMRDGDPVVRMRSADAAEKISAKHPEYLQPHKQMLIEEVATIDQQEVRWHVAQMLPRLVVSTRERDLVLEILLDYLNDKSTLVKTFSMEALARLAERETNLRSRVIPLLEELAQTGSPAMRSRGRKLLRRLDRAEIDKTSEK